MAIAYVGSSTGTNTNATSQSTTLPGSLAVGDLLLGAWVIDPASGAQTITPPSGWTIVPGATGPNACVAYRVRQTGDPTSVTATTTTAAWWESAVVAYSGVDTASPIDVANSCFLQVSVSSAVEVGLFRAPSVNPNWLGDQLVVFYLEQYDGGGGTITPPSGLTSRATSTSGPSVKAYDMALTTAAATGNLDASWDTTVLLQYGAQIALKASGATAATAAAPNITFGGLINGLVSSPATTGVVDFTLANPQTGDLIVIGMQAVANTNTPAASITPPSGYTQQQFTEGCGLYTHPYTAGDPTAVTFTFPVTCFAPFNVAVLRKNGTGSSTVAVDTTGIASSVSAGSGSASPPSLTPASTAEMLLCFYGGANESAGAWSIVPSGLTIDFKDTFGPAAMFGWVEPVASPTGTFTAGQPLGYVVNAAALLAKLATAGASVALTEVAATGAVGTATPGVAFALTEAAATGAVGTVTTTSAVSVALSGDAATGAVGTVGASGGATILSEVVATGAVGTVAASQTVSLAITGEAAAGAVGTTGADLGFTLAEVDATGAAGTVVATGISNYEVALTGTAAAGAVGTVESPRTFALEGVAAALEPGDVIVFSPTQALVGVAALGAAGHVVPSQGTAGVAAAGAVGAIVAGPHLQLSGNALSGSAGALAASSDLQLSGTAGAAAVGTPVAQITIALSGNDATANAGSIGSGFLIAPTAVTASLQPGQIVSSTILAATGVSADGAVEGTGPTTPLSSVGASAVAGIVGIDLSVGVTGCTAVGLTGFLSQPLGGNQSHVFILTYDHERTVRIPSG